MCILWSTYFICESCNSTCAIKEVRFCALPQTKRCFRSAHGQPMSKNAKFQKSITIRFRAFWKSPPHLSCDARISWKMHFPFNIGFSVVSLSFAALFLLCVGKANLRSKRREKITSAQIVITLRTLIVPSCDIQAVKHLCEQNCLSV